MTQSKVIIVQLRRPQRHDPKEMRTDPLWEFGSFGCTRCHRHNLMSPNKLYLLKGARLGFAQGGDEGMRLVHLTPPVEIIHHGDYGEATWRPISMPFKYTEAPLLIDNDGYSDFPLLRQLIAETDCPSWMAKFSSRFRARRTPLEYAPAQEVIEVFDWRVATAPSTSFALTYVEALPCPPPLIDQNREKTYQELNKPEFHQIE
jgi:hypothetical protein